MVRFARIRAGPEWGWVLGASGSRHRSHADSSLETELSNELPCFDRLLGQASQELTRLQPKLPAGFTFMWRGIAFSARAESLPGGIRLMLSGDMGAVPYSAENRTGRAKLLTLVRCQGAGASPEFQVSREQRLVLLAEVEVQAPVTAAAILGWTAHLLLRSKPYIDLAESHCLRTNGRRQGPEPSRAAASA